MEVRKATMEDAQWIAQELKAFNDFYISELSLYHSDEYTLEFVSHLIQDHVFFVAASDSGSLLGFVAGHVSRHPYNPELTKLMEMFWWVPEENRHTGAGSLLLDVYTEWGKRNVDWTIFSLTTNTPVDPEVLEKRGYKKMETNYFIERSL